MKHAEKMGGRNEEIFMANGKRKTTSLLIKSGVQGDFTGFRAASEAVIKEERKKPSSTLC